jgi:hypothetical protein
MEPDASDTEGYSSPQWKCDRKNSHVIFCPEMEAEKKRALTTLIYFIRIFVRIISAKPLLAPANISSQTKLVIII